MAIQLPRWRFSVDDYHKLAAAGILGEDDRVELLDGELVPMSPIGSRHAASVKRCNRIFQALGDRVIVGVQDPIRLGDFAEPEPDLSILKARADFYAGGHATASDILLVIEVADTSAPVDRHAKLPLYGRARIPETWILDLSGDAVETHREPAADGYRLVRRYRRGERIAPLAFPDLAILVDDLLGPPEPLPRPARRRNRAQQPGSGDTPPG